MIVYSIQNYWVFELGPSFIFQKLENTTFRKLDLFPSSGEGPLERANLSLWTSGQSPKTQ
jgi:hypothetical protein